jgi:hypothetical protein
MIARQVPTIRGTNTQTNKEDGKEVKSWVVL